MNVTLRPGRPEDAPAAGAVCYEGFTAIAGKHNFPPDFPSAEVAQGMVAMCLSHPAVYAVVAEDSDTGRVVGSNFLWEGDAIAGVGPITVAPDAQDARVGRRLMDAVLERAREKNKAGVRLVQAGYHMRSLSLYAKLGFVVREPLVHFAGEPLGVEIPGHNVRPMAAGDIEACNDLCRRVHGHDRAGEVGGAVAQDAAAAGAAVVERAGRITGYTPGVGFFAHAVGETSDDVKALIGAAREFSGPGFLLPTRNADLFGWCLSQGLRAVQPFHLMSLGLYNDPAGAFLPSVLF